MGQIQINTPYEGPQIINIEGEAPTEVEQQAIFEKFFNNPKPDFSTATNEEIQDYARKERLVGRHPITGDALTEEEYISEYKEPGVDYASGVKSNDLFSRFTYGSLETDEERKVYLDRVVGSEGYRVDGLGRFLITKDGRKTLGMGEGPEVAIDEEGLSWSDVKEFAGATVFPITAGIGTSLIASGVGFVPGILLVGASMAGGKLLDEAIESARGLQRQSGGEIIRDAAFEGVFGVVGEGLGRTISGIFGRILKGPGGKANEALRAQAREIINKGYRPTVAGATDESFRPILNRLQAVYEGVFPSKGAADANLKGILDELRAVGIVDRTAIQNLEKAVSRDIHKIYGDADQALARANLDMNKAIENEIRAIRNILKGDGNVGKDLAKQLTLRKSIFDEDVDRLYTKVEKILGGKNRIIPTGGLVQTYKGLLKTRMGKDIAESTIGREIMRLGRAKFATPTEMNRLRTALTDASYNTELIGGLRGNSLTKLKEAITQSFDDSMITLAKTANKFAPDNVGGAGLMGTEKEIAAQFAALSEGLNLLSRTNKFYSKGISRFDDVAIDNIMKEARRGTINSATLYNEIVIKNNPELLEKVLRAVRGVPTGRALGAKTGISDLARGRKFLEAQRIGNRTIAQALDDVKNLPPNNRVRINVENKIAALEKEALEVATMRGTGAEMANTIREGLAKNLLDDAMQNSLIIDKATSLQVIDPLKLSNALLREGPLLKKLFGTEYKKLNDVIHVLRRSKADLPDEIRNQLATLPLGRSLLALRNAELKRAALDKDVFLKKLQTSTSPQELADIVFKDVDSIVQAEKILKPAVMQDVRTAAMGNILRKLGATTDEAGQIQLTTDFVEKFTTGRLGTGFQNILRSYGPETINKMFGPNGYKALNQLATDMIRVSNRAIAAKGGLAAPQIALGLGIVGLITAPMATLPAMAGFWFMSRALRHPAVLKMMMASSTPNKYKQLLAGKLKANDPVAQGFQALWQIQAQAMMQYSRMVAEEMAPTKETIEGVSAPIKDVVKESVTAVQNLNTGRPPAGDVLRDVEIEKLVGVR